ncbi:ATP-binding protein [Streptomyces sp. NPDC048590]|uniref:ATP-binding protein n=1 Tax=Streptomyces sp. NPDC048590 TaxID=3365574 RepID=UPI003724747A
MHPYTPPPQAPALCPAVPPLPPGPYRTAARTAPGAAEPLRARREVALSLTLPGDPRSAAVGRRAVASALPAYGLRSHVWPATLAVTELIAHGAALTPGRELYLSLRHRDAALRLVLWDQHPAHPDADARALCEVWRRRALWLLAAVVDDWGGEWGSCEARPPHQGVKSWVLLPE